MTRSRERAQRNRPEVLEHLRRLPERFAELRSALEAEPGFLLGCSPQSAPEPREVTLETAEPESDNADEPVHELAGVAGSGNQNRLGTL